MSNIGHNSDAMLDDSDVAVARAAVRGDPEYLMMIESIERMEEEKKGVADDIRDKYTEIKSRGYDTKITRQIIKLRKMETADRQEMEALLETYKAAVGLS